MTISAIKKFGIAALLLIALPVSAQSYPSWMNPYTGGTSGSGYLPTNSINQTPGATVSAQSTGVPGTVSGYTPLEPLGTFNGGRYQNFADYLSTVYKLAITVGALIAVVMLVTGGVRYMLSESFTDKSAAKSRIVNALWGLTILIGSFLILYTINPNLLNFSALNTDLINVNQKKSGFTVPTGATGGTSQTSAQQLANYAPGTSQGTASGDQMRAANQLLGNSHLVGDKYILFDPSQLSASQLNTVMQGYNDYCQNSGVVSNLSLGLIHFNTQTVPGSVFGASGGSALVCTDNNL